MRGEKTMFLLSLRFKETILILCLLPCLAFFHAIAFANQASEEITVVAVFDFKNQTEHEELGRQIAEITRVIIPEFRRFEVIDRGMMRAKIAEKGMGIDEVLDSGMGFEAVKLVDSDYFIVGDVGRLGNMYSLNIKLVDSKTGTVVKASGLEFENMLEIRKIVRGLLSNVLGYGKVSGKPVISEDEYEKRKKEPFIALSISVGSTIVQAASLGAALLIPAKDDPNHLWPSLAKIIPPATPIYTEDWNITPYIIGFSVGGGVFNFVGRSLINNSQGDAFRNIFGIVLIIGGVSAKIYSVVTDILNSTSSVENYNNSLKEKFFISNSIQIYPVISNEFAGLGVMTRF